MDGTHRYLAVLRLPDQVPQFIEYVDLVISKMTGNAYFTTPTPTLAVVQTANNSLKVAQIAARGGGVGVVTARNTQRLAVKQYAQGLRGYVQSVADGNEAMAATIIESAGMFVRSVPVRTKVDFEVVQAEITGSVITRVKSRGPRATYWWESSVDQKSWSSAPVTRTASTTFSSLTAGTTYYFRYQVLTSAGLSDWSQIVSFMVK